MTRFLFLITAFPVFFGCRQISQGNSNEATDKAATTTASDSNATNNNSIQINSLFTINEAERILGEKAKLSDSSTITKDSVLIYQCAYKAVSPEEKTGKSGAVYFMLEEYESSDAAHHVYSSIKSSNENHEGIEVLKDLGDEAYFHSDGENFCFILVRKDLKMLRMKVNKLTVRTSIKEFHATTREITKRL